MTARFALAAVGLFALACRENYRIGEYVWVEWEGRDYPAYIVEQKSKGKLRVHFDGYDTRWDQDVTLERVKGRVVGQTTPPPPPEKVARAMGREPEPSASAGVPSVYNVGDRVRVRWRGSVYAGVVVSRPSPGKLLVHYDGYGSEWDEAVSEDRLVGKR
ncbi:MAG TPA: Tudor-knot domain-containing protein [Polyangiaceae bacterium]|nr:Tudor-knot domain-containing protein [Polyangiaceae bacterium]